MALPVCLSIFPSLMGLVFSFIVLRFARHSEEDVARRTPPMPVNMTRVDPGIRQPTAFPPPFVLRLRRLSSSGDAWTMAGGSTESIKRAQSVTALDSTTAVGDSDYVLPIGSPTDAPQGI